MKITHLIAALERTKAEHGNLTVAEEKPLAWVAVQHIEVRQIPVGGAYRFVPTVMDGELVVTIRAQ